MRIFLLVLLAGACLAKPKNLATQEEQEPSTIVLESSQTEESEVKDSGIVGAKLKGETGESSSTSEIPSTDQADNNDGYMSDSALDNLNMFYDCSDLKECKLVTGKGMNIGSQLPLKGDRTLTKAMQPTIDHMVASLSKIQSQKKLLADLQREMNALSAITNKGISTKSFQPITLPTNKGKGAAPLMLASKGSSSAALMREASMCPMLKFEMEQGQKVQYELKKQLDGANSIAAMNAAHKSKVEQELRSSEFLREASKNEAHKAASALMMEKSQNDMLRAALAKVTSEKNALMNHKNILEKQLGETQVALMSERMQKMQLADALKKTTDEKEMCLSQLMVTQNAFENEKKDKEAALDELAKTANELTLTKNALEVETEARKQCQEDLAINQAKLAATEEALDQERAAHAKTQDDLMQTMIELRATRQALAVTELRLKQTQTELVAKEQDLARTQATLEATEDKLARTMAALEATQEELRNTQNALEDEKNARARVERQLAECNANLEATEAARQALEEAKQKLEDELADTQAALLDMTAQKNQMEDNFEGAMKLLAEEKMAKAVVDAQLAEANAMKMQLALQLQQAIEMFNQAKKANEELTAMFEQVKQASALIQMQLEKLQLENFQLQTEVNKLKKEQEAALALAAGCPPTYEKFDGSCYKYVREKTAWKPAQESCMRDGGNLVSIETANEQMYVLDHLKRHGAKQADTHVSVGGYRDPFTMLWKWKGTGVFVGRDTPSYWYSSVQKDKAGSDCMALYMYDQNKIGKFTSRVCEVPTSFVCEVNILPPGMSRPTQSEIQFLQDNLAEAPAYLQAAYQPMTKSAMFTSKGSNLMAASKGNNLMASKGDMNAQLLQNMRVNMLTAQIAQADKRLREAMAKVGTSAFTKAAPITMPKGDPTSQMAAMLAAMQKGEQ